MLYLSIDVEASGPFPGLYSLVSVGAVPVIEGDGAWSVDEGRAFYIELKPLPEAASMPEAMAVHGLTTEHLAREGVDPADAVERFAAYVAGLEAEFGYVKAAAWPSSFDGPYVGWYAQRFLGHNPLGHSQFDIPSFAMGLFRCGRKTLLQRMKKAGYKKPLNPNPHHALADAVEQGWTLAFLLNYAGRPE